MKPQIGHHPTSIENKIATFVQSEAWEKPRAASRKQWRRLASHLETLCFAKVQMNMALPKVN